MISTWVIVGTGERPGTWMLQREQSVSKVEDLVTVPFDVLPASLDLALRTGNANGVRLVIEIKENK
jgi:hypothetical protein